MERDPWRAAANQAGAEDNYWQRAAEADRQRLEDKLRPINRVKPLVELYAEDPEEFDREWEQHNGR